MKPIALLSFFYVLLTSCVDEKAQCLVFKLNGEARNYSQDVKHNFSLHFGSDDVTSLTGFSTDPSHIGFFSLYAYNNWGGAPGGPALGMQVDGKFYKSQVVDAQGDQILAPTAYHEEEDPGNSHYLIGTFSATLYPVLRDSGTSYDTAIGPPIYIEEGRFRAF